MMKLAIVLCTSLTVAFVVISYLVFGHGKSVHLLSAVDEHHSTESTFKAQKNKHKDEPRHIKTILELAGRRRNMNFEGCEYSNCVKEHAMKFPIKGTADLAVIWGREGKIKGVDRKKALLWLAHGTGSPLRFPWGPSRNRFDGTLLYTRDATIYAPYAHVRRLPQSDNYMDNINYAANKTKGALAYVSDCNSEGYNRLALMEQLSKYIDVDIFGKCTGKQPCERMDFNCEASKHTKYRFFLAFENSLCRDYITEKLWARLNSSANFVPVAMGGLSVEEYTTVAPPNSFIHVYNFSSIKRLGKYLRHLMDDDAAYNEYHQWRQQFYIVNDIPHESSCELCKLANHPEQLPYVHKLWAKEYNKPSECKTSWK